MALLSESEYEQFKNTSIGDSVRIETNTGTTMTLQAVDWKGATLVGICVHNGRTTRVELRGGRGRDDDADQPFIALGIDGPDAVETLQSREGKTHIEGIGDVEITQESGRVSYDEEVVSFENLGERTVKLG